MPRRVGLILLSLALVCAGLASYLVLRYVREQGELAKATRIELQPVVVATADIPIGTRVTANLVAVQSWPKPAVPEGAVAEPRAVLNRIARGEIARREPIFDHRLFPEDLSKAPGIMSVLVPAGRRAMTVGVNEVIGVSGFILPKSRVDVIATRVQGDRKTSETILRNIDVLAVGTRLEQKGEQHVQVPTVTLAVTTKEAERLALALHDGKIHIVLRSILDAGLVEPERPTEPPNSAPAVRLEAREFVVEVIRGGKRTFERFVER